MFKDMQVSNSLNDEFRSELNKRNVRIALTATAVRTPHRYRIGVLLYSMLMPLVVIIAVAWSRDRHCNSDSNAFAFLVSTRVGGHS